MLEILKLGPQHCVFFLASDRSYFLPKCGIKSIDYLLMDLLWPAFLAKQTDARLSVLQLSRDLLVSVDGGLAELEELREVKVPLLETSLSLSISLVFSLDL